MQLLAMYRTCCFVGTGGHLHLGASRNGVRDLLGQNLATKTVLFTAHETLVARLQQVRRGKERVVTVQRIHDGQVILVQVHSVRQVREVGVNLGAELGLGQQTGGAIELLDRHALEDRLESLKLLGQGDDWVGTGEETTGSGDHEGGHGVVIRTGIVQDVESGSTEGPHCESVRAWREVM